MVEWKVGACWPWKEEKRQDFQHVLQGQALGDSTASFWAPQQAGDQAWSTWSSWGHSPSISMVSHHCLVCFSPMADGFIFLLAFLPSIYPLQGRVWSSLLYASYNWVSCVLFMSFETYKRHPIKMSILHLALFHAAKACRGIILPMVFSHQAFWGGEYILMPLEVMNSVSLAWVRCRSPFVAGARQCCIWPSMRNTPPYSKTVRKEVILQEKLILKLK